MNDHQSGANRIRLLLIDDDEDSFILTRDLLREFSEQKYTLEWVATYDAALDVILRRAHAAYLVDYHLGARTGLDLIRDARNHECTAPMILLTGVGSHEVDVSAMHAGASDYLVKGELTARMLERSIRYAIGHHRDLEALRQSAVELQRLNGQLRESENALQELNASKDKFFSIIAHDLRSPFVSLLGYTELLNDSIADLSQAEILVSVSNLHAAGRTLFRLLENLLSWSRIQTGRLVLRPMDVDAFELVHQVTALFNGNAMQKEVTLRNRLAPECLVHADPQLASTVLENLVSNAIKFTPRGGSVCISAKELEDAVEISVRDTGVGITEQDVSRLFRLDGHLHTYGTEHEEGTGLGLILCAELLAKSGGSISVSSELGAGSVFRFTLPRVFDPSQSKDAPANRSEARASSVSS